LNGFFIFTLDNFAGSIVAIALWSQNARLMLIGIILKMIQVYIQAPQPFRIMEPAIFALDNFIISDKI